MFRVARRTCLYRRPDYKLFMLRNGAKVLVMAALVGVYFALSDHFAAHRGARSVRRGEGGAVCLFVGGALLALWGDTEVGTLRPVSLRGMFVLLGVLLMIFAVILANALRESAA
jgi:peptidoglycan/LPS O-acetylase OafA/YrhL